jgi:hypothetical protein
LLGEAKSALTIGAVDSAWVVLNELEREMVMALSDAEIKFLSGFSERWFFGIVEKLEKPKP